MLTVEKINSSTIIAKNDSSSPSPSPSEEVDEGATNPFTIPKDGDEEQHLLRLKEHNTTEGKLTSLYSLRNGSRKDRKARLKELLQSSDDELEGEVKPEKLVSKRMSLVEKALKANENQSTQKEREPISDFVQSKRDMFLLQLSIIRTKEETGKLEQQVAAKDEGLTKSEQLLEEDAKIFDTFLKESDKKAQDAIRDAEKEAKRRMEKMQEVKKLNHQMQQVQGEINKYKDALEDCLKYKSFLDSLTPLEWFEERKRDKEQRQEKRRRERILRRQEEWKVEQVKTIDGFRKKMEENSGDAATRSGSRRQREKEKADAKDELEKMAEMEPPDYDDEPFTDSDEEPPMYFKEPQQLLEIFSALEDENLFLIQNMQETDQAAEELKKIYAETSRSMDDKAVVLLESIQALKDKIAREEANAEEMKRRSAPTAGNRHQNEERTLKILREKVKQVYDVCRFNDGGSTPTTLSMLSDVESRMDEILTKLAALPDEYVKKSEKQKEKKYREMKRLQNQADQHLAQEERNRKALERSLQPPKKRTGRPVSTQTWFTGTFADSYLLECY